MKDDLEYFNNPEFKETLEHYEAMLNSGHMGYMEAAELVDVADYYATVAHDDERSQEAIDLALRLHPDAAEPQLFMARRLLLAGRADEAVRICDSIADQDDLEVIYLRAEIMVHRGLSKQAYEYIISIAESDIVEKYNYFYYDAAYIFMDNNAYDEALLLSVKLEEVAPAWHKTLELRADVLLSLEKYSEALPYLNRLLDVKTFNTDTWNWQAEAYNGINDLEKALESVDYSLALDPDNARALQLKAWFMQRKDKPEEAHDIFLRLQELYPDDAESWIGDAQTLMALDKPKKALAASKQALTIVEATNQSDERTKLENLITIHEDMAFAYSRMGNPKAALKELDIVAPYLDGPDEHVECELMKFRVCLENELHAEADTFLNNAVNADTQHACQTCFRAATLLFEFYYDLQAEEIFTSLVGKLGSQQEEADCQAYLAACHKQMGRHTEALRELRKAVDMGSLCLESLFAEHFPEGVKPNEYPDYYYYEIYGRWPE